MNSFISLCSMPPDRLALPGLPEAKEKSRSKKPVPANSAVAAAGVARRRSFLKGLQT